MHTSRVDDERPPICPACGVTMVAAELSAHTDRTGDWVCLECEETGESEEALNFGDGRDSGVPSGPEKPRT